jgi:hypothetical protein
VRLIYQWDVEGDGQNGPMSMFGIAINLTELSVPTRGDKEKHIAKNGIKVPRLVVLQGKFSEMKHILVFGIMEKLIWLMMAMLNAQTKTYTRAREKIRRSRDGWIPVRVPAIIDPEVLRKPGNG